MMEGIERERARYRAIKRRETLRQNYRQGTV
jgi:hypothetical protein